MAEKSTGDLRQERMGESGVNVYLARNQASLSAKRAAGKPPPFLYAYGRGQAKNASMAGRQGAPGSFRPGFSGWRSPSRESSLIIAAGLVLFLPPARQNQADGLRGCPPFGRFYNSIRLFFACAKGLAGVCWGYKFRKDGMKP